MNINYDYYRIFYFVAKYGNISQAAKLLLNNQPNLTRTIKEPRKRARLPPVFAHKPRHAPDAGGAEAV